jgi:hypothetical protein
MAQVRYIFETVVIQDFGGHSASVPGCTVHDVIGNLKLYQIWRVEYVLLVVFIFFFIFFLKIQFKALLPSSSFPIPA